MNRLGKKNDVPITSVMLLTEITNLIKFEDSCLNGFGSTTETINGITVTMPNWYVSIRGNHMREAIDSSNTEYLIISESDDGWDDKIMLTFDEIRRKVFESGVPRPYMHEPIYVFWAEYAHNGTDWAEDTPGILILPKEHMELAESLHKKNIAQAIGNRAGIEKLHNAIKEKMGCSVELEPEDGTVYFCVPYAFAIDVKEKLKDVYTDKNIVTPWRYGMDGSEPWALPMYDKEKATWYPTYLRPNGMEAHYGSLWQERCKIEDEDPRRLRIIQKTHPAAPGCMMEGYMVAVTGTNYVIHPGYTSAAEPMTLLTDMSTGESKMLLQSAEKTIDEVKSKDVRTDIVLMQYGENDENYKCFDKPKARMTIGMPMNKLALRMPEMTGSLGWHVELASEMHFVAADWSILFNNEKDERQSATPAWSKITGPCVIVHKEAERDPGCKVARNKYVSIVCMGEDRMKIAARLLGGTGDEHECVQVIARPYNGCPERLRAMFGDDMLENA